MSDDYKGAYDLIGYKRRSRRIRGLDAYFETEKDRLDRETLKKNKEQKQKEVEKKGKPKLKFNFDIALKNQNAIVSVDKATHRLIRYGTKSGFVSINCSKTTGTKRSCIQDAVINVGDILGIKFNKEKIYEFAPPSFYDDTPLNRVIGNPYVSDRLSFWLEHMKDVQGGNEVMVYRDLRNRGGKYIIICIVHYDKNKKEKHAFVFDADYRCDIKNVKGAIIDNQVHTKLTGIEDSDVKDVKSMRRVCMKLYGGKTFFTHCYKVQRRMKSTKN